MTNIVNKPKVKASLLSKVSHELKSPIHGIMSLADYLENNLNSLDSEAVKKCISEINKSSQTLNSLIDNLFDISKMRDNEIQFNFEPVNLDNIISEAIEIVQLYITNNKNITIEQSNNSKTKIISADQLWFRQLLTNILLNAIKFTSKGTIKILIEDIEINKNPMLRVAISDEGIGIASAQIDTIFNEFSKGAEQISDMQNNGLGLAICEEIVVAHGGTIRAYNNEGKGTTIEFVIPLNRAK